MLKRSTKHFVNAQFADNACINGIIIIVTIIIITIINITIIIIIMLSFHSYISEAYVS